MKRLLCLIGLHTGQKQGGTMMYTCPRCRGSFWQKQDFSYVTDWADMLIEQGRYDEAMQYTREEISRRA